MKHMTLIKARKTLVQCTKRRLEIAHTLSSLEAELKRLNLESKIARRTIFLIRTKEQNKEK